ncbi:phage tail tape measure C-terminal domain-containing protein [Novosphingobium sp. fls2-241-R2A-195]|uniref:phage tail length tape measure family protein n=1 Tax=Novosphingobium sp. fls2-241-R2A-195 TaxID=3040296 RepID=UPI0025518484|nr:phage tail tape measure C-terminal domain-containing protein [Novosphingobium sp. fls2-241-R2A-195]
MAQATVLGSLLVQLGMDSAQFERASQRAQSTVSKMAAGIGVSAKDVVAASNRMGVSITAFAGQVSALQNRLNPGNQALANYRREMNLLRESLRIGAISQAQFRQQVQTSLATYRQAGQAVATSSGAMQAGMQQLQFQLNDVVTMWALGARPMQIFASQAGQVTQAIGLMTNGAGKFGAFMAGPWGMAITSGVIILSSLIPKLMEADKAMEDVTLASSGLADAQSVLGDMFDLTTGKLKKQNAMLQLNAQLMAINLRAQASSEKAQAKSAFGFANGALSGVALGEYAKVGLTGNRGALLGAAANAGRVRAIGAQVDAVDLNSKDAGAILSRLSKQAEKIDFSGLNVTQKEFLDAIAAKLSSQLKTKTAQDIEKSLADGVLAPSLRDDPKDKKKRAAKGKDQDKIAARYDEDMNRLQAERANLEADYTQTIESRYQANIIEIDNDLASFKANTLANKDIGKERQQALILEATKNAELRKQLAENDRDDALANKASEILQQDLRLQMDQVQLRGQLATTVKEQKAAALELLDLQDRLRIAELDRIMATEAAGSAAWDNARVEKQSIQSTRGQREELVNRQNMSPLERYRFNLRSSVSDINSAMENIQVDAMDGLTNGIANAIAGTQKLGDVFKQVAQQIIADLIRIQIQKAVVGGLSNALGSIGGIFGGGASLSSTSIAGAGSFDFSSVALPDYMNMSIAGARAAGGPVRAGLPYLTGEFGKELFIPDRNGSIVPNHELSQMGASRGGDTYYIGPGAEEFWGKVDGIASGNANQAVITTRQRDTRRATRKLGKR